MKASPSPPVVIPEKLIVKWQKEALKLFPAKWATARYQSDSYKAIGYVEARKNIYLEKLKWIDAKKKKPKPDTADRFHWYAILIDGYKPAAERWDIDFKCWAQSSINVTHYCEIPEVPQPTKEMLEL